MEGIEFPFAYVDDGFLLWLLMFLTLICCNYLSVSMPRRNVAGEVVTVGERKLKGKKEGGGSERDLLDGQFHRLRVVLNLLGFIQCLLRMGATPILRLDV